MFAGSMSLIDDCELTFLHVFPFSPREGTAATRLPGAVDGPTIARRARELRELGAAKREAYERSRVGGLADVVVVGRGPEREGLTGDYLTVFLEASGPARGARFDARLAHRDGRLVAQSVDPSLSSVP